MARFLRYAFLFSVWLTWGSLAPSEQTSADHAALDTGATLSLGPCTIALNGPWRFQIGDSPIDARTHQWLWAEPRFDDSHWETVDLTPVPNPSDVSTSDQRHVKGWTARGHAGYWGWAWYRLRIRVAARPGDQMAIDGPISADDAWELFANGQLLGSLGEFDSRGGVRRIYHPRPLMFRLPPVERTENGAVTQTIAFRVWMGRGSLANANAGGLYYAPLLVAGSAAETQLRVDWQRALIHRIDEVAYIALFLLLAVLAASLTLFDPSDRVYLWVAATMLIAPIGYILIDLRATTTWLDSRVADVVASTDDALLGGWMADGLVGLVSHSSPRLGT